MKRFVLTIGAVALILASCASDDGGSGDDNSSGDVAATVNDVEITTTDVENLTFDNSEVLSPTQFAEFLGALVQWSAVEQSAVEEFGIEPSEDEVNAEAERLVAEFGQGVTREEFLEAQGISEELLQLTASQIIIEDAVRVEVESTVEEPTVEDAEQAIAEAPSDWTEVCAVHILVETEDEATAVLGRLDDGEDFAVVAQEVSIDTGSGAAGGDLGCTSPAIYVPEFAEATMSAEIGVVVGPVQSQFGYHVIRVDERTDVPVEDVRQGLVESNVGQALSDWFVLAIESADVTVVEEYGTWQTDPFPAVVAPS